MGISDTDLAQLLEAKRLLERPNLAATLTHRLGTSIEKGFELLPENWSVTIRETVDISLNRAMELAMKSLAGREGPTLGTSSHSGSRYNGGNGRFLWVARACHRIAHLDRHHFPFHCVHRR